MRLIDADTLNYVRVRIYHDDGTIGGYNAVVPSSEIKNAPTVDAVPVRHGRYIHDKVRILDDDTGDEPIFAEEDRYTCSECGKKYLRFAPDYNYCPECGATMDAEREEE